MGAELQASSGYVPLEDIWPVTAHALLRARLQQPKWVTLNDNFGKHPSRVTEWMARRWLQRAAAQPSAFERA